MFWCFGHEADGMLAPWPGIEPSPPALEGEVLTIGPPGKAWDQQLLIFGSLRTSIPTFPYISVDSGSSELLGS